MYKIYNNKKKFNILFAVYTLQSQASVLPVFPWCPDGKLIMETHRHQEPNLGEWHCWLSCLGPSWITNYQLQRKNHISFRNY